MATVKGTVSPDNTIFCCSVNLSCRATLNVVNPNGVKNINNIKLIKIVRNPKNISLGVPNERIFIPPNIPNTT